MDLWGSPTLIDTVYFTYQARPVRQFFLSLSLSLSVSLFFSVSVSLSLSQGAHAVVDGVQSFHCRPLPYPPPALTSHHCPVHYTPKYTIIVYTLFFLTLSTNPLFSYPLFSFPLFSFPLPSLPNLSLSLSLSLPSHIFYNKKPYLIIMQPPLSIQLQTLQFLMKTTFEYPMRRTQYTGILGTPFPHTTTPPLNINCLHNNPAYSPRPKGVFLIPDVTCAQKIAFFIAVHPNTKEQTWHAID